MTGEPFQHFEGSSVRPPRVKVGQVWHSPQGSPYVVAEWAEGDDGRRSRSIVRLQPVGLARRVDRFIGTRVLRARWTYIGEGGDA